MDNIRGSDYIGIKSFAQEFRSAMKNKKAITQTWVIGLILLIIGAGIIILFMGPFNELSGKTFDKTSCQTSVDSRAAILSNSGLLGIAGLKLPALECSTNYICLTKASDCDNKKYESVKAESIEDIKKEMAGLMFDCWDMLRQGEKQFLKPSSNTQCIICSVMQFQQSIQNDYKTITGLNEYLFEKTIPNKGMTYMEFIDEDKTANAESQSYDTSKKLAVVYVVGKDKSTIEQISSKVKSAYYVFKPSARPDEMASLAITEYSAEELYEVCKDIKSVI